MATRPLLYQRYQPTEWITHSFSRIRQCGVGLYHIDQLVISAQSLLPFLRLVEDTCTHHTAFDCHLQPITANQPVLPPAPGRSRTPCTC